MPRRPIACAGILAAALVSCTHAGASGVLIVNDFAASAEGWQVAGDTGPARPEFHPSAERSGGYISNVDEAAGETWYFRAPESVLSHLAAAAGGRLEYRLKQDAVEAGFADDDVVIVGPAGRLSYRFDYAPGTEWTDFSVPLVPSANWRWNWNAPATADQIRAVLNDPWRLEIRGEYRTGDDTGAMDRFVLYSARAVE